IQEAVFRRLSGYSSYRPGTSCGVVGLGSIGRAVLLALLQRHSKVHVFDKENELMKANLPLGAVPCSDLQELFQRSDCVFGCKGNDFLEGPDWGSDLPGTA